MWIATPDPNNEASTSRDVDSVAQQISAAGWHVEGTPKKEKAEPKTNDLKLEVKRLQEALTRLTTESKAAQQSYQSPQGLNRSTSSLLPVSNSTSSQQLYSLSHDGWSREPSTAPTPLLSPLYTHDSFNSTPPTSISGDQTPSSSTSWSSQLGQSYEAGKESAVPRIKSNPPTKKAKNVQFSDVEFLTENHSTAEMSREEAVDLLVKEYPELCEAPARMYDPDGQPLPPTKKQETSELERKARKEAIRMDHKGTVSHSLLKVSVLLERRCIIWRRVEGMTSAQKRPAALALDKDTLDPWRLNLDHGDIDISDMAKRRLRKTFELSNSHKVGQCDACAGTKVEACHKCKGSTPDGCWWCKGSGKTSGERCKQCSGKGFLVCQSCDGKITTACSRCQGQGRSLYSAFLQVSMVRVDLDPIALSSFVKKGDERSTADICIEKSKGMVAALLAVETASEPKDKDTPRQSRAHRIIATMHQSTSHLVKLEIPQAGKLVTAKKNSTPPLRSSSIFQRKIQFLPVYFIVPSDPTLSPVQLSANDFQTALAEIDSVTAKSHKEAQANDTIDDKKLASDDATHKSPSHDSLPLPLMRSSSSSPLGISPQVLALIE